MASFDERVNAAMEGFCAAKMDGKGTEESVCNALCAADATEPEIGAVRRWLAGETVDEAATPLPRMLSETIRALAEAQQVAERAQGGDAVRQWLDGAGVHEDALPKRLRMTLVELRCARKQRDEYSQRIAARADQPPLGPHERVAELVTEFDTERSERRAVERQRDEAQAEVARLKRELDEERAWMREEKRHNIRMRAALDEIAVCLGRDGDDLKVLVEDVQRCSDGVVAADEKIERLKQERDALAAKVRDARYAADAVAKEEPPERVPTPEEAVVLTSAYDLDIGCDNGQDGDGDVFVAVVRRSDAVCVGEWRGEALLNALLSDIDPEDVARFAGAPTASPPPLDVEFTPERVPTPEEAEVLRAVDDGEPWAMKSPEAGECAKAGWIGNGHDGPGLTPSGCAALARFEAQEKGEKTTQVPQPCEYCNHEPGCCLREGCHCAVCRDGPTPDDGGDLIGWKARALAAEAEVSRLRAALERATRPVGQSGPEGSPACMVDLHVNAILAARRAEAMGGSDADA